MTELGNRLAEARKLKNISLDELHTITKIQKRYLKAIEEGQYEILPGKFYARAFIKQYAEAVDLDPDRLFVEFASDIPKSDAEPTITVPRSSKKASANKTSSAFLAMLPKLLIAILVVCIAVFIWLVVQKLNAGNDSTNEPFDSAVESQTDENVTIINENGGDEDRQGEDNGDTDGNPDVPTEPEQGSNPAVPAQPVNVQQLVQVSQQDGTTPYTTYELIGAKEFKVELKSNGRSYIGIKNGIGKSFYQQELGNGALFSYDFTAEKEIEFNIGRTLDIEMKINGQPVAYPYPPNEKVHQKINIIFTKATE